MTETVSTSVDSITAVGTKILTWFLEMATAIFNYVVENPICLIYLVIKVSYSLFIHLHALIVIY